MSALIGALRVTLGLDSAAFEKGAARAETRMNKMTAGIGAAAGLMGGALAAIGLSNLVGQAFEMASALDEDAQKLGLTVEGLQELRLAADQSGIAQETLAQAITKLNRSMGDLQLGKKAAVDAFAAIGLSADDLKGKKPDEALALVADALNKLPDPQQRVAIGMQLMGRSFSELLPLINGGSKALEDYKQQAKENGEITTQDAKNLDAAADAWSKFKTAVITATANIVAGLIPLAEKVGQFLDNTRAFFAGVHDKIAGYVRDLLGWFAKLKGYVDTVNQGLAQSVGKTHAAFTTFADDAGFQLTSFSNTADAVAVRVQKSFKDMADGVLGALNSLSGSIKAGGFLGILSAVVGLGLQLGSVGAFGSTIAARINNPAGGVPGRSAPTLRGGGGNSPITLASLSGVASGGSANTTLTINPSPLFSVAVDQRVAAGAPTVAGAAVQQMRYRQSRALA